MNCIESIKIKEIVLDVSSEDVDGKVYCKITFNHSSKYPEIYVYKIISQLDKNDKEILFTPSRKKEILNLFSLSEEEPLLLDMNEGKLKKKNIYTGIKETIIS